MVWQGHTNPEIALAMGTTEQVIKNHLRNVFDKLGVWTRLELALYVASNGGAGWAAELPAAATPKAAAAAAGLGASNSN